MSYRWIALAGALALVSLAPIEGQTKAKNWTVPRTPDGKPDLQGVWTNATLTPLERPTTANGKLTLTDAEAKEWEKKSIEAVTKYDGKSENPFADAAGSGGTGGYNALFVDRGTELARVDGQKRTSLVVDPPDGHVPPITAEARTRSQSMMRNFNRFDSVKDRPIGERCLLSFGNSSGPVMLPVMYNNNYQIVQTPDTILILVEMVHDARIVRMNAQHAAPNVKQWLGDSVGHWEGDTLVVDTTNFNSQVRLRGSSENLHIIERFTRVDQNNILYRATVEDGTTFTKPWTVEYPFLSTKGPIYEYACHEGNYAMTDILGGARKADEAKK